MLFEQSLSGVGESTNKNFTHKKTEKNENEVYAIFGPAAWHQQSYAHSSAFYQIYAPSFVLPDPNHTI